MPVLPAHSRQSRLAVSMAMLMLPRTAMLCERFTAISSCASLRAPARPCWLFSMASAMWAAVIAGCLVATVQWQR